MSNTTNPDTSLAAHRIFVALFDPDLTFPQVAERVGMSIPELAAWLTHPDATAVFEAIYAALAARNKAFALSKQAGAIEALYTVLEHARAEPALATDTPCDSPAAAARLRFAEQRRREHDATSRAASLLLRFTHGSSPAPRIRAAGRPVIAQQAAREAAPASAPEQARAMAGMSDTAQLARASLEQIRPRPRSLRATDIIARAGAAA